MSSKARARARSIIAENGITLPSQIDLEAIALLNRALVTERHLAGCEGRLIRRGDRGIISVSDAIGERGQRRFCIAHEIGHFLLHQQRDQLSLCTMEMLSMYAASPEEIEANTFASELLMPTEMFRSVLPNAEPTLKSIEEVTRKFDCSLTAMLRRFVELGPVPCGLICSEMGAVRWWAASSDFDLRMPDPKSKVSAYTGAGEYFLRGQTTPSQAEVAALDWLPDCGLGTTHRLKELTWPQPRYNACLSLLWC